MQVIDVHCHIVPAEFPPSPCHCREHWPRMDPRAGNKLMMLTGDREFRLVDSRCWDVARRLADMDAEGVDIQVLSPMPELLSYWIDTEAALSLARHVNGCIAEMVAQAPTRLAGLGMVPLQDPELAAKELGRLKVDFGLRGVEIGSSINGRPPGDPRFEPFFAEAERLGMAVFVHALHPAAQDRLVGPDRLQPFILFPTDVGLAAASLITGRILEKYPHLRIGLSHGGGTLSAFLPRLQLGWQKLAVLNGSFASPKETARLLYFDNIVFAPTLLRYLIETVGTTQVFVGSDYPFAAGQERSAAMFDALEPSPEDLAALRGGNARRFLAL